METVKIERTNQRNFIVPYKRFYFDSVEVSVPDGVSVVLKNGQPVIEKKVTNPNDILYGMIELIDMQVAIDQNIVIATHQRR